MTKQEIRKIIRASLVNSTLIAYVITAYYHYEIDIRVWDEKMKAGSLFICCWAFIFNVMIEIAITQFTDEEMDNNDKINDYD